MEIRMTIKQGDNGWVLKYPGHDCFDKTVVCQKWSEVLKELDEFFGWYDLAGKLHKINPYI